MVSGLNFLAVASKISPNLPPKFSALEPLNHETYNLLNFLARVSKFSASEPLYGKISYILNFLARAPKIFCFRTFVL